MPSGAGRSAYRTFAPVRFRLCMLLGIAWLFAGLRYPGVPAGPRNVVLLIGDGMGLDQVSAAWIDAPDDFVFEQFSVIGFQKTTSSDNLVTDSGAGATAMATGVKTYNSAIGIGPDSSRLTNIVELAAAKGLATGVVATSSLSHATPAGFLAHRRLRGQVEQIAADVATAPVDVLIGGGERYFNQRFDGRDLLDTLRARRFAVYPTGSRALRRIDPDENEKLAYFTSTREPVSALGGRQYLPRAAELAMRRLRARSPKGYFLLIEGSQIDWAGHQNDGAMLLGELWDFQATIWAVLKQAREQGDDTLVIVTADHETGGLALGKGSKWKHPTLDFSTKKHTADLIPVFATGPGAEAFGGIYENTAIFDKMRAALGL